MFYKGIISSLLISVLFSVFQVCVYGDDGMLRTELQGMARHLHVMSVYEQQVELKKNYQDAVKALTKLNEKLTENNSYEVSSEAETYRVLIWKQRSLQLIEIFTNASKQVNMPELADDLKKELAVDWVKLSGRQAHKLNNQCAVKYVVEANFAIQHAYLMASIDYQYGFIAAVSKHTKKNSDEFKLLLKELEKIKQHAKTIQSSHIVTENMYRLQRIVTRGVVIMIKSGGMPTFVK